MTDVDPRVDAYLENLPPARRSAPAALRALIFQVVPEAQESIRYGMPYYEAAGQLCAFASQKRYMSFYVFDTDLVRKHAEALESLDLGKSCIRFRRLETLPLDVVATILEEAYKSNNDRSE